MNRHGGQSADRSARVPKRHDAQQRKRRQDGAGQQHRGLPGAVDQPSKNRRDDGNAKCERGSHQAGGRVGPGLALDENDNRQRPHANRQHRHKRRRDKRRDLRRAQNTPITLKPHPIKRLPHPSSIRAALKPSEEADQSKLPRVNPGTAALRNGPRPLHLMAW